VLAALASHCLQQLDRQVEFVATEMLSDDAASPRSIIVWRKNALA
jgi:hypothetical protein